MKDISITATPISGADSSEYSLSGFNLRKGGQILFSAIVRGNTTINQSVTWSVAVGNGSINSSTGLYTAPSTFADSRGMVVVVATSNQDGVTTGSVVFTLQPF